MRPLPPVERDAFLDAVRGLALVGILAVNLEHLAGVGLYASRHGVSESYILGREVLAFFFSGKFYTIFSILFGLGLALQYQRFVAAGLDALSLLRRRLGWLLGLGALHGIFLFDGDILGTYAILGLFALRYLGQTQRPWNIARFLLAGYVLMWWFSTSLRAQMPAVGSDEVFAHGSFREVSGVRLETWLYNTPLASLVFGAELVGLFLLGMYLAPRWQTFGPATLWRVVAVGLLVGIPVNLYNAQHPDLQPLRGLGGLAFALVYVALFRLFWPRLGWLHNLQYAGRMPLSNYLLQSAVMSTVFYGYGLGLYGQVHPLWFPLIAVGFVALQVILSRWWLGRFGRGPLEALWRSFTYRVGPRA
ncbi:DUF418 domain-containing protein [Meiothermus hypogaeus]|uniref:DUF418 domain-containing protein n=1 Tax=Meiothermus hypogaeus TaxID=884155 RepID=A0ABX9MPY0_9DEIN|nr:DUF418 domain-containing protein [Meiothermus hypogaeus]RIH80006.1 hypothetical protein Mhypo_00873 [Meiothermus hypogaeus]